MRYLVYVFDEDRIEQFYEDNGLDRDIEFYNPSLFQSVIQYGDLVMKTDNEDEALSETDRHSGNGQECLVWDTQEREWMN